MSLINTEAKLLLKHGNVAINKLASQNQVC